MILSNRAARKSRSIIFAFTTPPVYARFRQQTFGNDYVNLSEQRKKKYLFSKSTGTIKKSLRTHRYKINF